MSKLKAAFQGICQRHLCDDETKEALKQFIRVQDLVKIIETYLVDEFNFETELMVLAHCSSKEARLANIVIHSPNKFVQNWLYFIKKRLDIPNNGLDLLTYLSYSFMWGTMCNRPCCWYHYNTAKNYKCSNDCECGQPITYAAMTNHSHPDIFQHFSHLDF